MLRGFVEENLGYRLDGLPESVRQAYVVIDAITFERVERYVSFEELARRVLDCRRPSEPGWRGAQYGLVTSTRA